MTPVPVLVVDLAGELKASIPTHGLLALFHMKRSQVTLQVENRPAGNSSDRCFVKAALLIRDLLQTIGIYTASDCKVNLPARKKDAGGVGMVVS